MRLLDRYIARTVITGSVLALMILTGISVFFSFVGQLGDVNDNYTVMNAITYVGLTLPRRAYEMLPTSVLLGGLMGLGALAASSELIVIRAAGVSVSRIAVSVMRAGLIIVVFAIVLGEFIAPPAEQYAQAMRSSKMTGAITLQSKNGFWARDGKTFVNIKRVLPGSRLDGITIYEYDQYQRLVKTIHAPTAVYQDDGRWLLKDVRQSNITTGQVSAVRKQDVYWDSILNPDFLDVLVLKPVNLSALSLFRYIDYLEQNGLDTRKYDLAFWVKLVTPLSTLVMLLIAVPFVFGSLRSGSGGQRMLFGVLIGLGFHLLNQSMNHVGLVYGMPAVISAMAPSLLVTAIGIWFLRRVGRT